ncbi:MAG: flagellin [Paracoccaceae bacterium]
MNAISIGDLALSLANKTRGAELKSRIAGLTQELSTGQVQDVRSRISGDFSYVSEIEREISLTKSFALAATETGARLEATQTRLSTLENTASDLSSVLTSTLMSPTQSAKNHAGLQARQFLESAVSVLNGTFAGQSLFSGIATNTSSVRASSDLVAMLKLEVAGLSTASDIHAAIESWFDDPSGFSSQFYTGSSQSSDPVYVSSDISITVRPTADHAAIRNTLKSIATSVLAVDPDLNLLPEVQNSLLNRARDGSASAEGNLIELQAETGFSQSRLDEAAAETAARKSSFELARNNLLNADPYETATRLEETQFQLDALFAITARSARLSLLNHL